MKRLDFTKAQIALTLKQVEDGRSVVDFCRRPGTAEATFYNWLKRYNGLMPSAMKRLKIPDEENAGLKQWVADLSLGKAMLQDVIKRKR